MDTPNRRDYRNFIARALMDDSARISDLWLQKLEDVVNESTRDIFPTEQYLDHIPSMIDEIGKILKSPDAEMALVNSLIERKADELGTLRHQQKATVNQLLREYDLLSKVLEDFIIAKTRDYPSQASNADCIELMASVARVVRSILQGTVDSFVERYMSTIQDQTEKIVSFNAFLSHELKTPLQAAQLNMELLMETKDMGASDARDLLLIQTSIQQASSLLLNIESLIQNSESPMADLPTHQEVDLSALFRDIRKQLSDSLSLREVKVSVADNLGSLQGETAKLKLIFMNLLTNAIKYSDPKEEGSWVKVELGTASNDKQVVVIIRDNGLGIEEHMQKEIFKLRVRAHEDADQQHEVSGYGMGLYLVTEALRDINGSIALKSTVGEGAQFSVTLPRQPLPSRIKSKLIGS